MQVLKLPTNPFLKYTVLSGVELSTCSILDNMTTTFLIFSSSGSKSLIIAGWLLGFKNTTAGLTSL